MKGTPFGKKRSRRSLGPSPRPRPRAGRRSAFTLVELVVVIAVIGILATIVIVRYSGKTDQAKVAAARAQLSQLEGSVIEFQAHCSRLPNSLNELVIKPSDCPRWQEGGYLKGKKMPKDPWGHEFVFRLSGTEFEIRSLGSDGKEGGTGYAADLSSEGMEDSK